MSSLALFFGTGFANPAGIFTEPLMDIFRICNAVFVVVVVVGFGFGFGFEVEVLVR